jgi:hypothetical protein
MMIELSGLKQEILEKIKESSKRIKIPEKMRGAPEPNSIPVWEKQSIGDLYPVEKNEMTSWETSKREIPSEMREAPKPGSILPWDTGTSVLPSEKPFSPVDNLISRNEDLEGKKHPKTEVPFERKTVKDADGNDIEGVFPKFDSKFDVQLPPELYQESDVKQFEECNRQLKEAVENDPELAKQFTPEQLEQIKNGETPDGYTWHHNEEIGKMQLVDSETHEKTGHTGGKVIWGGGQENR